MKLYCVYCYELVQLRCLLCSFFFIPVKKTKNQRYVFRINFHFFPLNELCTRSTGLPASGFEDLIKIAKYFIRVK